uniref:Uncharacterized protein n=1 Tax=Romanomermis culicivorax TaxID=13658 RepID=A0A915HYK8_ROMCU
MPQVQGSKGLASEFLGVDRTPFIVRFDSQAVKSDLLSAVIPKHLEYYASLDSHLTLNLFFAMFHFHLCGDIQNIFPVFVHDFQTTSAIAYKADQIHKHLYAEPVLDHDLDVYKVRATKLPFSSWATFYMWQEAIKRFMSHIDQDRKVPKSRNSQPSQQTETFGSKSKKMKQQLEEEEDEQYALIDKMEGHTVTDPATHREYEALGRYLFSHLSDAKPVVARMTYGPCFVGKDPLPEPATTIEEGRRIKADIGQHLERLKVD